MKKYLLGFALFFGFYIAARLLEAKVPFVRNLTAKLGV